MFELWRYNNSTLCSFIIGGFMIVYVIIDAIMSSLIIEELGKRDCPIKNSNSQVAIIILSIFLGGLALPWIVIKAIHSYNYLKKTHWHPKHIPLFSLHEEYRCPTCNAFIIYKRRILSRDIMEVYETQMSNPNIYANCNEMIAKNIIE
jgi:hypothetical protein